mmetsp:Transcript_66466/g.131097  ORF Transcript_66466/g.131097 Transcript_66466/m.131097 type:complete len:85 (-) Transcript_66466:1369-1623(-)
MATCVHGMNNKPNHIGLHMPSIFPGTAIQRPPSCPAKAVDSHVPLNRISHHYMRLYTSTPLFSGHEAALLQKLMHVRKHSRSNC